MRAADVVGAAHEGAIGVGGISLNPTQLGLHGSALQGAPLAPAVDRLIVLRPPALGNERVAMLPPVTGSPWQGLHVPDWHVWLPLKQSTNPSCCEMTA
jgi:hypothetical protein